MQQHRPIHHASLSLIWVHFSFAMMSIIIHMMLKEVAMIKTIRTRTPPRLSNIKSQNIFSHTTKNPMERNYPHTSWDLAQQMCPCNQWNLANILLRTQTVDESRVLRQLLPVTFSLPNSVIVWSTSSTKTSQRLLWDHGKVLKLNLQSKRLWRTRQGVIHHRYVWLIPTSHSLFTEK